MRELAAWWVVLCLVWIATLSSWSVQEVATACALAVPCAFAALGARRAEGSAWRPRGQWFAWLARAPGAIARETVGLLRIALLGKEAGEFRELRLPEETAEARRAARSGLSMFTVSVAPGSVVVDSAEDGRVIVLHSLPVGGDGLDRSVSR
ncbi:MAG TPA: hypothetical protein VG756_06505 [Pseudonocardiaceae bacterium]|jgi:multisubunit Na+/H+ antiporter MnhE subunit|nr:hypothetical protein [Pseudonocardiaceae bacterium]